MKYSDLKFRIYDYKTMSYIQEGLEIKALLNPKESFNIEMLSPLKTTKGDFLYDNDIIVMKFYKDNEYITYFYAIVSLLDDQTWILQILSKDDKMGIQIQHFKILINYPRVDASYDFCYIIRLGNIHDRKLIRETAEREYRSFQEISKEFSNF